MSRKKEATFKNLGINKESLFEKLGDVILSIGNTIEHIDETLGGIEDEHRIDPFDLESLQDNAALCAGALVKLKNDLVCLYRIDGDVYEDLLYSIVKAVNCLGNRVRSMTVSHNAMVCYYSKQEVIEVPVVPADPDPVDPADGADGVPIVPVVVRRRGRPPAKAKGATCQVVQVPVLARKRLDATTIDEPIEEIKINILSRIVSKAPIDITCEKCQVKMVKPVDEVGVVICPICNRVEYQEEIIVEDSNGGSGTTETKRKPGNDVKFYELINSIQGKLVIEEKLEAVVTDAINQAKINFKCGIDSYTTLDKWLRNSRDDGGSGKKKYNKIYKYGPLIYSIVSGFELASLSDREYDMIEAAYDIIYVNYRETNCKNVSGESTNSIKAEFYIEKLIDIYVNDFKRVKALKEVIPPRTSKSNSTHTIVWNNINNLGLLK